MQLSLDFDRPVQVRSLPSPENPRSSRGALAYRSGLLAEANVADRYREAGYSVLHSRWRGKAGEIDLIVRRGDLVVFVEVKSAHDFSRAAERINRRQMDRICMAACEFCGTLPTGQMTEMRLDAALVDQFGRVEIIENAFGAH
ncbi:YraN family protein [Paracoccus sediminicola]|uniref:YraN family protein n=1 Tax=Paracoccus sediminicola TaxID=3017783 RepID=UPI0022F12D31|nr:YraN family protein [Paracoccus sediminicola]WBU55831.1 YraN family protein [Paracoccus sediminicola]